MKSQKRFIGVVSGIQGGKTTIGAIWLLTELQKAREAGKIGDWLIAAPTFKILQQSTLPKFKQYFPRDWGEWKEGNKEFDLAWGGKIYLRSTEDPDKLEGMTCLGAWLDEAGQMKEQAWINVQGRLSINQGRCIMTTTPYAMNWFFREVFKKVGVNPDVDVVSWGSGDNPGFPAEEVERAKASLTQAVFERRYLGKFKQLEGLVYPDFEPDEHIVAPFDIPANWPRFAGLDFGYSVPAASVCIAEDPQEHVFYVYREFYKKEAALSSIAEFLKRENLRYVLADSQGAREIAELNKFHGVRNVKACEKATEIGFERIGKLLREGRLKFFKGRCPNTIDEIEEYHYAAPNPDKADGKDRPVKKNDHCMDALRYGFSKVIEGLYPEQIEGRKAMRAKLIARQRLQDRQSDPVTGY